MEPLPERILSDEFLVEFEILNRYVGAALDMQYSVNCLLDVGTEGIDFMLLPIISFKHSSSLLTKAKRESRLGCSR